MWSTPAALALGIVLWLSPVAAQVPPHADWQVFDTEHFQVTFAPGLEETARSAAREAEAAHRGLESALGRAPEGRIKLLVTDYADLSNGFANVFPWNQITVFARPPVDGFALVYFEDWLRVVVTHELAHIFHLDHTGWIGRLGRAVFGRLPSSWPLFPQRSLPTWAVEGLATYYESSLTRSGRLRGTFHDMMLRTAVLEHRFEDLGQVSGESPVWPSGDRPYLYGSRFFDYLLDRYGRERMDDFVRAVSSQLVPYRLNAAGEAAFGVELFEAWGGWEQDLRKRYQAMVDSLEAIRPLTRTEALTGPSRFALNSRVSPDGGRVVHARSDGTSDVQLQATDPDGSDPRKLTRTNGLATLSFAPDGSAVFSQLEFMDPYRIRRDLYHLSGATVERLTRGARLSHPDVHPEGGWAVAVEEGAASSRLVRVELEDGSVSAFGPEREGVYWAYPRWSPDGRWLAVARWEGGGFYDVVILDDGGREVERVTRDRAVDLAPTWGPGGHHLLWSSDRTGIPNLFAVEVDPASGRAGPVRQVTHVATGAGYPVADPLGRWIYMSVYHADGWAIERIPWDPSRWFEPLATDPRFTGTLASDPSTLPDVNGPVREYSPWGMLLPRYWELLVEERGSARGRTVIGPMLGAGTSGRDLVRRHAWDAWVRVEADGDARTEGSLAYSWAGLGNPVIGLSLSQLHSVEGRFTAERPDEPETLDTLFLVERQRAVGASVTWTRPRMRTFSSLRLTGALVREEDELLNNDLEPDTVFRLTVPDRELAEGSVTLAFSNARGRALSTGREDGVSTFVRYRVRTELALDDTLAGVARVDGGFDEGTGRLSAYKALAGPGFTNHVLAVRVSGGAATGPGADAFHFDIGGASGRAESVTGLDLFGGSPLLFPVRGYPRLYRTGRYAWSGSLEWRAPLTLVHKGLGPVPLYFDRVSVGAFLDAGNAWGPDREFGGIAANPRAGTLWSVGAEVMASVLPFWSSFLDLRLGVAVPLRGGEEADLLGDTLYLRLGWSF